jgi:hypothetical protein
VPVVRLQTSLQPTSQRTRGQALRRQHEKGTSMRKMWDSDQAVPLTRTRRKVYWGEQAGMECWVPLGQPATDQPGRGRPDPARTAGATVTTSGLSKRHVPPRVNQKPASCCTKYSSSHNTPAYVPASSADYSCRTSDSEHA